MDAPITLSLITALTPAVLSKTYWLDAQNTLQKKTGGQLVEGSRFYSQPLNHNAAF